MPLVPLLLLLHHLSKCHIFGYHRIATHPSREHQRVNYQFQLGCCSLDAVVVNCCQRWQTKSSSALFVHEGHVLARDSIFLLHFRVGPLLQGLQQAVSGCGLVRWQVEVVFVDEVLDVDHVLFCFDLLLELFLPSAFPLSSFRISSCLLLVDGSCPCDLALGQLVVLDRLLVRFEQAFSILLALDFGVRTSMSRQRPVDPVLAFGEAVDCTCVLHILLRVKSVVELDFAGEIQEVVVLLFLVVVAEDAVFLFQRALCWLS